MSQISLHSPSYQEMWYRKKLLSDPVTMSYNKDLPMDIAGYNRSTGCILFPEKAWTFWVRRFLDREPDRYYAYISADCNFVGEASLISHGDKVYELNILIEGAKRCQGFGQAAMRLLLERAFITYGASAVTNYFDESHEDAMKLHEKLGFEVTDKNVPLDEHEKVFVRVTLTRDKYLSMRKK